MNEVFVFGAGASYASAGTPLGAQLVWEYHRDCTPLKRIDEWGIADTQEDDVVFSNFHKFLEVIERHFPQAVGESARFRNRGAAVYHRPEHLEAKEYSIDEILKLIQERSDNDDRKLIKKLIFEHLSHQFAYPHKLRPNELYQNFIDKVVNSKSKRTASIISFNFDLLLDEVQYFDYMIEFDSPHPSKRNRSADLIPFIKLNGSLNWGICWKCKRLSLYSCYIRRGFYEKEICCEENAKEPFIIVPYENYADKMKILWSKAEHQLRLAHKVTIIGYSFPEYDQKAIESFSTALNENVELQIVDYCTKSDSNVREKETERIKVKYREMFPHLKREFKISLDGFADFVENYQST